MNERATYRQPSTWPRTLAMLVLAVLGPALAAVADDLPELDGWTRVSAVTEYTPETLWDLIDGAAELYLRHDFEHLATAEIRTGDLVVTLAVYRMGSRLDAFGIFRLEAAPGAQQLPIGAGAQVSPPFQCLLAKDRFYVKVEAFTGEIDAAAGRSLLTALAAALPGDDGPPPELARLPRADRIPGSDGFSRGSYLGFEALDRSLHARYADGNGRELTRFLVLPGEAPAVDQRWAELSAAWVAVPHDSGPVLARKLPGDGLVGVLRTADGIIGVAGAGSKQELLAMLEEFSDGGASPVAPHQGAIDTQ